MGRMKLRGVLVVVMFLAACFDDGESPDHDAGPDEGTFRVDVGERCDAAKSPLCAGGFGVCIESQCELRCEGAFPSCPDGLSVTWGKRDTGSAVCYCTE